jgi:hypothetical protein
MIQFLKEIEKKKEYTAVTLKLRYNGDSEIIGTGVEVVATDEHGQSAIVVGLRSDGTVVRYVGQSSGLSALGFKTDSSGLIKMFN